MGEVASSCSSLSLPRCLFWGRNNSEPLFCTVTPSPDPHSCPHAEKAMSVVRSPSFSDEEGSIMTFPPSAAMTKCCENSYSFAAAATIPFGARGRS